MLGKSVYLTWVVAFVSVCVERQGVKVGKTQKALKNKPKPRFRVGQTVWIVVIAKGEGVIANEQGIVKSVRQGKVTVAAMLPDDGPFDSVSGRFLTNKSVRYSRKLVSENPEANKAKKSKVKPRFKAGQTVWTALHGGGTIHYEERKVKSVRKGRVLLENGHLYDRDEPFSAITGKFLSEILSGFFLRVLSRKPKGYLPYGLYTLPDRGIVKI